jgi:hypothetical protein
MCGAHTRPDLQPILFWVIRSPNPKVGDEAEGLRLEGVDCATPRLDWAAGSAASHKGLLGITFDGPSTSRGKPSQGPSHLCALCQRRSTGEEIMTRAWNSFRRSESAQSILSIGSYTGTDVQFTPAHRPLRACVDRHPHRPDIPCGPGYVKCWAPNHPGSPKLPGWYHCGLPLRARWPKYRG